MGHKSLIDSQTNKFYQNINDKDKYLLSKIIFISLIVFLVCSSARYILFQATAYDLSIFDQCVYLISQGLQPISTYMGYHILGDHAAFIWYPIALLYKIYPSVYWLFLIQAFALAIGVLPIWYLALQAGLSKQKSLAMVWAYLLYPVVFNVNLFDFHPEVIALPTFLAAVWFARARQFVFFFCCLILILSCKAVLSLTVAAMGFWLLCFEKRRWYGLTALILGISWFFITSGVIIPTFSGKQAAAVGRYSFLGNSVFEIGKNLILKPGLILGRIFSWINLSYLILLFAPIAWGISAAGIAPLIAIIPCVFLNILADYEAQKDLLHQYSLPALPFLLIAAIATLEANKGLVRTQKGIIIWSLVGFLCLAKFTHFGGKYLETLENWSATRAAIAQIQTKGSVLTTSQISTHLSHRQFIQLTYSHQPPESANNYDYVLLDTLYPGWGSDRQSAQKIVDYLKSNRDFLLDYHQNHLYLFKKSSQPNQS